VDERLAPPGMPYEVLDGELVYVPPCDEPHGRHQFKIAALIEAHVASDFTAACDMQTRTSKTNDFAPDVSVYPRARDPRTGGRQLEHLAFEVVSTQSLSHAGRKAAKLIGRGVRRVFAVDTEQGRALEWSSAFGAWTVLDPESYIDDVPLAAPLPIAALLTEAAGDDDMVRALIAKGNRVIEASRVDARQRGWARGVTEGLVEALLAVLAARGIALDEAARARIVEERDPARLRAWIGRASCCTSAADLFAKA
jgi:hypothetical protein